MTRTLVVVTHHGDKWKLEMLCKSMSAFLDTCDVHIVYNEIKSKYDEWCEWFEKINSSYLKRFSVTTCQKKIDVNSGWISQQILKILVAKDIRTPEYVLLDSKNFFIKKSNINEIVNTKPTDGWLKLDQVQWAKLCCEKLGLKLQLYLRTNDTPYVLKTDVARKLVKEFGTDKDFIDWFDTISIRAYISPAEFILYELFEIKSGNRDTTGVDTGNNTTLWSYQMYDYNMDLQQLVDYIKFRSEKYNVNISGFHRSLHDLLSQKDIEYILHALDLEFLLPDSVSGPF